MEADLSILLRFVDNASAGIKDAMQGARQEVDKLSEKADKVKNRFGKFGEEVKKVSKDLRAFRNAAFVATAALAVMVKGLSDAAKYNQEAKDKFDAFTNSLTALSATIGLTFQPAIEGATKLVDFLRQTIEAAVAGFIKLFALITESFIAIGTVLASVKDNIKSIFTGEDPIGIVEAFRTSFARAMDIANRAADEFLFKVEETRGKIERGQTLEKDKEQAENLGKIVIASQKKIKDGWTGVAESLDMLGQSLAGASEMGKGFAKAAAAISMAMAIINTAEGVTRAFKDYPWPFSMVVAGIIAAAGAIQIATIAAQKFHSGGMIKAHDGLAVGEVPIIAQTGEGILSRRGMQALGGEQALNALNAGRAGGGGGDINVNIYYPKMSKKEEIQELAKTLGFEIERQLRYVGGS